MEFCPDPGLSHLRVPGRSRGRGHHTEGRVSKQGTHSPTHIHTNLPTYILTHLPTYPLSFIPTLKFLITPYCKKNLLKNTVIGYTAHHYQ